MAVRLWHGPADGQRLLSRGAPLLDGVHYAFGGIQPEALGSAPHQVCACRGEKSFRSWLSKQIYVSCTEDGFHHLGNNRIIRSKTPTLHRPQPFADGGGGVWRKDSSSAQAPMS